MVKKCYVLTMILLMAIFCSTCHAEVEEHSVKVGIIERTVKVGSLWGLTAENVSYSIRPGDPAENFNYDGRDCILINGPGEVNLIMYVPGQGPVIGLLHCVLDIQSEPQSSNPTYNAGYDAAQEVLNLVNQERSKRGLAPMHLSDELMRCCAIRAQELTEYFSHTRPNGESATQMISRPDYKVGENIAAGQVSAYDVVESWMNSPGHRANILDPKYTELGVGYAAAQGDQYGHYWVQMFRGRL